MNGNSSSTTDFMEMAELNSISKGTFTTLFLIHNGFTYMTGYIKIWLFHPDNCYSANWIL